jgi:hypothetical protein
MPIDAVVVHPLAEITEFQIQLDQEVGDLASSATSVRTPEGGRLSVLVNGSQSSVSGKLIDCISVPPKSKWNEALELVGKGVGGVCRSGPTLSTRRDVQMGRPARPGPGPGEARSVLGPARQARLENQAGSSRHAGSFSCPSPARSGPKRAGPTRLARKKRAKKRAMRAGKHILV